MKIEEIPPIENVEIEVKIAYGKINQLVDLVNSQQEVIEKLEKVITRETVRMATDDIIDALSGSEEPIEMVSKARYAEKLGIHDTHRTDKVSARDMASRNPSPEARKALETAVQQSQEAMNKMSTHRTVTLRIPKGMTIGRTILEAMGSSQSSVLSKSDTDTYRKPLMRWNMSKPKNPCPYHQEVELRRLGRANWYCKKCKRNVMMDLVFIHQALNHDEVQPNE